MLNAKDLWNVAFVSAYAVLEVKALNGEVPSESYAVILRKLAGEVADRAVRAAEKEGA